MRNIVGVLYLLAIIENTQLIILQTIAKHEELQYPLFYNN